MNLKELRDRLRQSIKNPDTNDVDDPQLTGYINSGYLDLAARYPFHQTRKRCSFITTPGERRYQLPGDLTVVLRLRNVTHEYKITKAGDRLVASTRRLPQWWPHSYTRYRNYVELHPTPNEENTIEVYYNAIPALLGVDEDIPILPLSWHEGIWMRAKWYYYLDQGDEAKATSANNFYMIWLSDKPSEIEEESVDIDSGVEVPTLHGSGASFFSRRYDDGWFDFRDGK